MICAPHRFPIVCVPRHQACYSADRRFYGKMSKNRRLAPTFESPRGAVPGYVESEYSAP